MSKKRRGYIGSNSLACAIVALRLPVNKYEVVTKGQPKLAYERCSKYIASEEVSKSNSIATLKASYLNYLTKCKNLNVYTRTC